MKTYYAIYPGPSGLMVSSLGLHESFDSADDFDKVDEEENPRQPTIWIADEEDVKSLYASLSRSLLR